MPHSRTYTNRDLGRFKRERPVNDTIVEDVLYTPEEREARIGKYEPEPSRDVILEAAKAALRRADERGLAISRDIGAQQQQEQIPLSTGAVARGVIELLNPLGGGFDLGPQASGAEQTAANVLPFLTGGGAPTVKWGAKVAAKGGRAALSALRGALTRPTAAAETLTGWPATIRELSKQGFKTGAEIPYASRQAATAPQAWMAGKEFGRGVKGAQEARAAVNPSQALRVAEEVAAETGEPIEAVLQGYTRGGGTPPETLNLLREMARVKGRRSIEIPSRLDELLPGPDPSEARIIERMRRLFDEQLLPLGGGDVPATKAVVRGGRAGRSAPRREPFKPLSQSRAPIAPSSQPLPTQSISPALAALQRLQRNTRALLEDFEHYAPRGNPAGGPFPRHIPLKPRTRIRRGQEARQGLRALKSLNVLPPDF